MYFLLDPLSDLLGSNRVDGHRFLPHTPLFCIIVFLCVPRSCLLLSLASQQSVPHGLLCPAPPTALCQQATPSLPASCACPSSAPLPAPSLAPGSPNCSRAPARLCSALPCPFLSAPPGRFMAMQPLPDTAHVPILYVCGTPTASLFLRSHLGRLNQASAAVPPRFLQARALELPPPAALLHIALAGQAGACHVLPGPCWHRCNCGRMPACLQGPALAPRFLLPCCEPGAPATRHAGCSASARPAAQPCLPPALSGPVCKRCERYTF